MSTTADVTRRKVLGLTPDEPLPASRAVRRIRKLLRGLITRSVWLSGDVADLRQDASGTTRFSLEEGGCRIPCVIWDRDVARQPGNLESGMRLAAFAKLDVYDKDARVQATVRVVRLDGDGESKRQLALVRRRLEREGLLNPRRKRPIPAHPRAIAIITSCTGAALHDILAVAHRRNRVIPILVVPAIVQGAKAVPSLIRAFGIAQRAEACELIIVARGGGAPAELAVFDDESLARAIAACRVPVIAAIGHESDHLLAEDVADLRVGTPSTAAERAIAERKQVLRNLDVSFDRARQVIRGRLDRAARRLALAKAGVSRAATTKCQRQRAQMDRFREQLRRRIDIRVGDSRSRLQGKQHELLRSIDRFVERERVRLEKLTATLTATDPTHLLARGFAVLSDESGRVLSSVADVRNAGKIIIRVRDGELIVHVGDR